MKFRPRLQNGTTPAITIHQLLTHTAGLTYGFFEPANGPYHRAHVSDGLDHPAGLSLAENLRRIASVPLSFRPGTAWGYSVATDVLGAVVEKASKETLPQAIERFVTQPLGMKDTSFSVKDLRRMATPYFDGRPEPVQINDPQTVRFGQGAGVDFAPSRILDPNAFPSGGAGMAGTADDYVRLLEAIRTAHDLPIKSSTLRRMRSVQTGTLDANGKGSGWGFGYGFSVLRDPKRAKTPQSKGTLQWGGAYGHSWFVDPARKLTVVALTNTAFEGMSGPFTIQIRDAVYGGTKKP